MFRLIAPWSRRGPRVIGAWLRTLGDWPFLALLGLLALGITVVSQQPLRYTIDIGYLEGWHSDPPFLEGWNTAEPYNATADQLSYRWSSIDSRIRLPGLSAQPFILDLHQLPATVNPEVQSGALHIIGQQMAISQPLTNERHLHLLMPPASAADGIVQVVAPTFEPPNDPRTLGAPLAGLQLRSINQPLTLPPLTLFWPVLLLPLAWMTARRWCVGRGAAAVAGLGLIGLLLAALLGDRLRFALAGGPLLLGAIWGFIVASAALWLIERYAGRLGVRPSPWLARSVVLLIFWLMLLRYGGRLYPESMRGDVGFHVNRQNEMIGGLIHPVSRHRGIDFPYPSGPYVLLAPLLLLPIAPAALVEWSDALFGALGLLPVAYIALRALRNERTALLATITYALLAPPMMALWWSFQTHIFTQEAVALLAALLVGGWRMLGTRRGIAVITVAFCLIFFGHFGLFINVSILMAGLIPLLWWRYRTTPTARNVYGLAAGFAIAEVLALGLFYSAYVGLILQKLGQFEQGGMSEVQGGRDTTTWQALLLTLWQQGLVTHYAVIGVPLAVLGGYWLWQRQRGSALTWLFWATIAVAALQGAIPFITSSTITTRWLSFCAWVVAIGVGIVLEWLWRRGRLGQGLALLTLGWIGGNTLWMWVQALGYRIRPPEPF